MSEREVIRVVLLAAISFILVVQLVLLLPALSPDFKVVKLGAGETISVMTGALTAAGLSAIYFQVKAARNQRVNDDRNARKAEYELAVTQLVKADNLHAEFNTVEMREHRNRAYEYLKFLKDEKHGFEGLAKIWVREDPDVKRITPDGETATFTQYEWSLSCMIAFYTRLNNYATSLENLTKLHAEESQSQNSNDPDVDNILSLVLGPFFWPYWEKQGLLELVNECDRIYKENPNVAVSKPYYVTPLRQLSSRATN